MEQDIERHGTLSYGTLSYACNRPTESEGSLQVVNHHQYSSATVFTLTVPVPNLDQEGGRHSHRL